MATKNKLIQKGSKARKSLIEGADYLAECVGKTLGPFGQNWFLEKGNRVTNDGATVAREIEHPDEIKNRGVIALREATLKTNDEAGDGTTTATVLAQAILKEATKQLPDEDNGIAGKMRPIEVVKKIETERQEVEEKLLAMGKPIESREALVASAKVSVEDEVLAELIGGMQWDLGKDGVIMVEETAELVSGIEKIHGIVIDNGFGTSVIMNDQEKQALVASDVSVILTDHVISSKNDFKELSKIFDLLLKNGTASRFAVVARAWSAETIQLCLHNIKNGLDIFPLTAPYTDQAEIMRDMAAVLGGRFIHNEETSLADIQLSDVGFASKIVAKRYMAIFTGVEDDKTKERVDIRAKMLEEKHGGEVSTFEKRNLEKRISQLRNGFALLKVGGMSEIDRKYKKDKADDAVNAVRAAFQEGTVPGAGLAFKEISESLPEGYLLKRPLLSLYEEIMASAPKGFVIEDWVKDPVRVLRIALEKACSVAATFATAAGVTVTEKDRPMYIQSLDQREEGVE